MEDGRLALLLRELNGSHIEVTVRSTSRQEGVDRDYTSRITWWTEPELPVIESGRRTIADRDGKVMGDIVVRLEDFQRCPGGLVARRVCLATAPWEGHGPVVVKEWLSGRSRPRTRRRCGFCDTDTKINAGYRAEQSFTAR